MVGGFHGGLHARGLRGSFAALIRGFAARGVAKSASRHVQFEGVFCCTDKGV